MPSRPGIAVLLATGLMGCDIEPDPDAWMERRARVECRAEAGCAGTDTWFDAIGGMETCEEHRLEQWAEEIEMRGLVFLPENARQCVEPHRRAWRNACEGPDPESGIHGECPLSVWYPEAYLD
jgi:hypothetical protein